MATLKQEKILTINESETAHNVIKYMVNLIFVERYKVITDIQKKDISFDDIIADL